MSTFLVSFRIEYDNERAYNRRYKSFTDALAEYGNPSWWELTSIVVISTDDSIDAVVQKLKLTEFDPAQDLFLITDPDVKQARIHGDIRDQEVFDLIPFLKKV